MRKAAIAILMLAILVAGCVRPAVSTTSAPLAYIDSVSSPQVYVGEEIKFSGHAISSEGQIVGYNWRSSINGNLSQLASFGTNSLTAGQHTIWFKAQDNFGNWSNEVGTNVTILIPGGPEKMSIRVFTATPPEIKEGEWSTLTWDVSGYGTVRIDPDIGGVSMSGSRSVQPKTDTIYTIFARNDEGTMTANTRILVTPLHVYTTTLYSVAAEDGTVRKDKVILDGVLVGQNELQIQMQGFLSFDISSIPRNAIIKDVDLDISKSVVFNSPFPWQGSLNIYNQQYGSSLRPGDYMIIVPAGYLYSWNYNFVATMMPSTPFTSPDFVTTMQKQLDAGSDRYQIRLQFEKYYYYSRADYVNPGEQATIKSGESSANYLDISAGNAKLTVRYVIPE
ncbi:MAG: hypothetical protein PHU70_07680 [Dehalococcoidia bacterium]|nr:hypothetical protein [Dehalococcoidia bacterium]